MSEATPPTPPTPQSDAAILADLEASLKAVDADGTTATEPLIATVQLHLEGKSYQTSLFLAPGFPYRYTEESAMVGYVAAIAGRAAMGMFYAHYDIPMPTLVTPEDES